MDEEPSVSAVAAAAALFFNSVIFTAVRMVSDSISSDDEGDLDSVFVKSNRLRSVCSFNIFSEILIQFNATSHRSRTISNKTIEKKNENCNCVSIKKIVVTSGR